MSGQDLHDALRAVDAYAVLVAAHWEAETVYFLAELFRSGVLPSDTNLQRLELACRRLKNAMRLLDAKEAA